jgi:glyoxylase-like metal-dependent hydrolase (beta-lactamase superfamily II)
MSETAYCFRLGTFDCLVVSDGTITVSDSLARNPDTAAQSKRYLNYILCLYVDTGKEKVLIDTGCGAGFQHSNGRLLESLAMEGIKPESIDFVIHSHGHADHIGGNIDSEGRRVFPNARHVIHPAEWAHWRYMVASPPPSRTLFGMFIEFARKQLLPLGDGIDLVGEGVEIVPGIAYALAPGHTPGSTVVQLSSGGERIVFIADIVHAPEELRRPDLFTHLDTDPVLATLTRDEVLAGIVTSRTMVLACHFQFPGLGHIEKRADGFLWNPVG